MNLLNVNVNVRSSVVVSVDLYMGVIILVNVFSWEVLRDKVVFLRFLGIWCRWVWIFRIVIGRI